MPLDYETDTQHVFTVEADDGTGLVSTFTVPDKVLSRTEKYQHVSYFSTKTSAVILIRSALLHMST